MCVAHPTGRLRDSPNTKNQVVRRHLGHPEAPRKPGFTTSVPRIEPSFCITFRARECHREEMSLTAADGRTGSRVDEDMVTNSACTSVSKKQVKDDGKQC